MMDDSEFLSYVLGHSRTPRHAFAREMVDRLAELAGVADGVVVEDCGLPGFYGIDEDEADRLVTLARKRLKPPEQQALLAPTSSSSSATSLADEPLYYIQDTRSYVGDDVVWWMPEGHGYTCDLDDAGLFTKKAGHTDRPTDVLVPREIAEAAVMRVVNIEKMRRLQNERAQVRAPLNPAAAKEDDHG